MAKHGGTKMYCPDCKKITICKAIPTTRLGKKSGQRWYRSDHEDINWFRRGRECLSCGHKFITAEMNEDFIEELVELRDALGTIKENAEKYITETEQAASTLEELSESLAVLRALKIYQKA